MRMLIAITFLFSSVQANAAEIAIALTDDLIKVDTSFSGARIVLFGAVTGVDDPENTVDIVSVVRGPATKFSVRRLEKRNLIWAPGETHIINQAPGLFVTTATRRLTDIAPLPDQASYSLGADFLRIQASPLLVNESEASGQNSRSELFKNAFLTEIEDRGLYQNRVGGVDFKKGGLFTININLPANTPVGDYDVSVYLYRNGELLSRDSAQLAVNKVGVERRIYDLAHDRPMSYGVFCVAMSLLSGWAAGLAFRK